MGIAPAVAAEQYDAIPKQAPKTMGIHERRPIGEAKKTDGLFVAAAMVEGCLGAHRHFVASCAGAQAIIGVNQVEEKRFVKTLQRRPRAEIE